MKRSLVLFILISCDSSDFDVCLNESANGNFTLKSANGEKLFGNTTVNIELIPWFLFIIPLLYVLIFFY